MKQRTLLMARLIVCAILFAILPAVVYAEDASAPKPAEAKQPTKVEPKEATPAEKPQVKPATPAPQEKPAAPVAQPEAPKQPEKPKAEPKKVEPKKDTPKPAEPKKAEPKPQPQKSKEATPKPAAKPEEKKSPAPKPGPKPEKPATKKPKPVEKPKPAPEPKWKSLLQKKHENFFSWLEKNFPQKAQELKEVGDKQPDKFVHQIGETMKVYEPIQKADKHNPKLGKLLRKDIELQDQRNQLLKKLRSAKEDQRSPLLNELKKVVGARFDVIIQKKQNEYDDIRRRLDWMNKKLEEHGSELQKLKDEKDQSVEKRTQELINGKVTINWK